ncbi:hypothetical protein Rumeso_03347 [Rubellimicrobium mesophilum DSM 19309]|uniref:Uncharacterized protein n=1 Tax=Rubellimicrobium mesophilum DSM 19309 TaxID=442562 RepID=A0A017HLU2_9RHOB|nr:hypothetical protein Rumeso_03347 [Rubellimicrobium mesophilum DSM 19309]
MSASPGGTVDSPRPPRWRARRSMAHYIRSSKEDFGTGKLTFANPAILRAQTVSIWPLRPSQVQK